MVNAVRSKVEVQSPNNKFGLASVTFTAYGAISNGSEVDPLSITQAT